MAGKIEHQFHGKLEPAQTAEMMELPPIAIEAIEVVVFLSVIFWLFFKFKNLIIVNSFRTTPENTTKNQKKKPVFETKTN
ncbi:MAG: hypothetical protein ACPGJV_00615 [Bacteriovoracaceae bacterium]